MPHTGSVGDHPLCTCDPQVPLSFDDVRHYIRVFEPLLHEEAREGVKKESQESAGKSWAVRVDRWEQIFERMCMYMHQSLSVFVFIHSIVWLGTFRQKFWNRITFSFRTFQNTLFQFPTDI